MSDTTPPGNDDDCDDEETPSKFINYYECPDCGHEWDDIYECQVDDDCPNCGKRHISPFDSEDAP